MAVLEAPPVTRSGPTRKRRLMSWLTTTDHKRIGILYFLNSFLFFIIAGVFAMLMRTELARPGVQILSAHAYDQVFSLHGTLMIFLFVFPTLSAFANYLVPLQIGAPDMAFPRVNALSFWLLPVAGLTILSGLLVKGGSAAAGWTVASGRVDDARALIPLEVHAHQLLLGVAQETLHRSVGRLLEGSVDALLCHRLGGHRDEVDDADRGRRHPQ